MRKKQMRKFVCHKTVMAAQIVRVTESQPRPERPKGALTLSYNDGGGETFDGADPMFARYTPVVGDYLVEYEDGYRSISPRAAFEGGYTEAPENPHVNMSFGDAIDHLKIGCRMARAGWNGKGMWLMLIPASHWETTKGLETLDGLPWIGMKTADDKFVPWLASQTDVLAGDWLVVEG